MNRDTVECIEEVIGFVEAHLDEKMDLGHVAQAAHYSPYHLHRMFAHTAGMTLHGYIQRRQLTEAARLLVFSERPVLEIALRAGYESQQAFTTVFKAMYKRTPAEYRQMRTFYPLQLRLTLYPALSAADPSALTFARAAMEDMPGWKSFIALVIDGFPCWEERAHMAQIQKHIRQKQVLLARDGARIVGAAVFSYRTGNIHFLAVHPQYRSGGVARALLKRLREGPLGERTISITTFREGDRADMGQRTAYKRLGFAEAELLTEFGYPTQRLVLPPEQREEERRDG